MPIACLLCGKNYTKNVHLFGFPRDVASSNEWCRIVKSVRPKFMPPPRKTDKICSDHFPDNAYIANAEMYKQMGMSPPKRLHLLATAIPSLGLNIKGQHASSTTMLFVPIASAANRPVPVGGPYKHTEIQLPVQAIKNLEQGLSPISIENRTQVQEFNSRHSDGISTENQTVPLVQEFTVCNLEQHTRPTTKRYVTIAPAVHRRAPGVGLNKQTEIQLPVEAVTNSEKERTPISTGNRTQVQTFNARSSKSSGVISTGSQTVLQKLPKSTQVNFMAHRSYYGLGNMPLLPQQIKGLIGEAIKCIERFKDLTFSLHSWSGGIPTHVEVTRLGWYNYPCTGHVPVKLVMRNTGEVSLIVLFGSVSTETATSSQGKLNVEKFCKILTSLSTEGRHLWCSGLPLDENYPGLPIHKYPCLRQHSRKCHGFYQGATNTSVTKLMRGIGVCSACSLQRRRFLYRGKKLSSTMQLRSTARSSSNSPVSDEVEFLEEELKKNENYLDEDPERKNEWVDALQRKDYLLGKRSLEILKRKTSPPQMAQQKMKRKRTAGFLNEHDVNTITHQERDNVFVCDEIADSMHTIKNNFQYQDVGWLLHHVTVLYG